MRTVKKRNMWIQVLLMVVTFGIYGLYWFYVASSELKVVARDEEAAPTLWTVLLFVPFGVFYSYFMFASLYEKVGAEKINKWIIFILWFFFSPAVWFLVQRDLNQFAEKMATPAVV